MSRTDLTELLERGAGPSPDQLDTISVWRRGRRRRSMKRLTSAAGVAAVVAAVVLVQPFAGGPTRGISIAPADRPTPAEPSDVVVVGDAEVVRLAAVPTDDPSLKDAVVSDADGLRGLWRMADIDGEAPTLPEGTVGIFVIARHAESTCRAATDVTGVEIDNGVAVVLLHPDGEFLRPCPGPPGSGAWTAFAVAIPDHYDEGLTGASSRLGTAGQPSSDTSGRAEDAAPDTPTEPAGRCEPSTAPSPLPGLPAGWDRLSPPPAALTSPATVWTGGRLLLIGGYSDHGSDEHDQVLAYDPATDTWNCLAPAPMASSDAAVASSSSEVYLVAGGHAAAFDLDRDAWTLLPDPPFGYDPLGAVWTGSELIIWGGSQGAAYDPDTRRWRPLPEPPSAVSPHDTEAVWTGQEVLVRSVGLGISYDPDEDQWRQLSGPALSLGAFTAAWDGQRLIMFTHLLEAAAYDPASDEGQQLPDVPLEAWECQPDSVTLDNGRVLAWYCGQAAVLDTATDTWTVLDTPATTTSDNDQETAPHIAGQPVAAGDVVLFAGASHEGQTNDLWRYDPTHDDGP